jgi:acyl carrier protein
MTELENKVIELLEELSLTEITDISATLLDDLAFDSLRLVMILVSIEETFDIQLDESDMDPFALLTVADVIELVQKYKKSEEETEYA